MRTALISLLFLFAGAVIASDGAKDQAVPKSKLIVALGDSLTEGYGIPKDKAYPQLLETLLRKTHKAKVINAGVSGSTTASAYLRLKTQLKLNPEILILALGSNDGLRGIPPETTFKNLEKTILLAKKSQVKVVLLGAKVPPNYGIAHAKKFEKVFSDLAKKHDLIFMPFLLEGVAGNHSLNQEDAIHPNESGHKIMAEKILPYVKKAL